MKYKKNMNKNLKVYNTVFTKLYFLYFLYNEL